MRSPPSEVGSTAGVSKRGLENGASGYEGATTGGWRSFHHRVRNSGSEMAARGFDLLSRWRKLPSQTKRAATAGALGFLLLFPPTMGQVMHPGWHHEVKSPVAAQVLQAQEIKDGAQIRSELSAARRGSRKRWANRGSARSSS